MGNSNNKEIKRETPATKKIVSEPYCFAPKDATTSQINQIKEFGEQEFSIYNEVLDSEKNINIDFRHGGSGCYFGFSVVLSSLSFHFRGRDHYELADNFIKIIKAAKNDGKSTNGELLLIEVYYNGYHINKVDYIEGKKKCDVANIAE